MMQGDSPVTVGLGGCQGNLGTTGSRGGRVMLPSGDQQGQKERGLRDWIRAKVSTSMR